MRTIRVTGKGNLKVHPDMTRIIEPDDIEVEDTVTVVWEVA